MRNKKFLIATLIIALLVGAFFVLKPKSSSQTHSQAKDQPRVISVNIVDGKLTSGNSTVEVIQDDTVTFDVTDNKADEFHLHGYDYELELEPGEHKTMTFKADKAGSFDAELHSSDTTVLLFVVKPE